MPEVQWDAWIMAGDDASSGVVLDLLEWKAPLPSGSPSASLAELGFGRLCILCDGLAGLHGRLSEAGHDVWSPPGRIGLGVNGTADAEMFLCSDLDGTAVLFVEGDSTRLASVSINCSDLEQSWRFYCDVLGLGVQMSVRREGPLPGARLRVEGSMACDVCFVGTPNDSTSGFVVDLLEWIEPGAKGSSRRQTNELGIFRIALLTDDINRDSAALIDSGVSCHSPQSNWEMGPGLPSDHRALFFEDLDCVCVELIESPPPH